jgi:hypothetical protein
MHACRQASMYADKLDDSGATRRRRDVLNLGEWDLRQELPGTETGAYRDLRQVLPGTGTAAYGEPGQVLPGLGAGKSA